MLQGVLESDADQLVSGTVGSGGKLVVFILKRFINPDRHGDGFFFFWGDDEFFHSDLTSLNNLTTLLLYLHILKKSITRCEIEMCYISPRYLTAICVIDKWSI